MAKMMMGSTPVTAVGIPQDIVDAADKVGMDVKDLLTLCVNHSVEAARSWLAWLQTKLPTS